MVHDAQAPNWVKSCTACEPGTYTPRAGAERCEEVSMPIRPSCLFLQWKISQSCCEPSQASGTIEPPTLRILAQKPHFPGLAIPWPDPNSPRLFRVILHHMMHSTYGYRSLHTTQDVELMVTDAAAVTDEDTVQLCINSITCSHLLHQ